MNAKSDCESPESLTAICDVVADAVNERHSLTVCGAQTKMRPAEDGNRKLISTIQLRGIVDHQASDFTITARAGTPIQDVVEALAQAGQHLPFDATFIDRGATVGGLVATGLNGPCRLRYGGLRDFVIGCQHVDGNGTLVRSGGKVVKNAAGFDIPKFMIGSAGRFGILTEVTFKVFPRPQYFDTLLFPISDLDDALQLTQKLLGLRDFEAIEVLEDNAVVARISGETGSVLSAARDQIHQAVETPFERVEAESTFWTELANGEDRPDTSVLVKIPLTMDHISTFDESIISLPATRRYSVAGNVGLLCLRSAESLPQLHQQLKQLELAGQIVTGVTDGYLLGHVAAMPFLERVKKAMDPYHVFGDVDCFANEQRLESVDG